MSLDEAQLQQGFEHFIRAAQDLERGYAELRVRAAAVDLQLQATNRALEQSLAEREAIFAALPLGLVAVAEDGGVRTCNREAERLLAAGREAGVDLERCGAGETEVGAGRVRIRRVEMADGELVLLEDRTQLRELEREVHRLDRLAGLSELALGIAHEIKNPLNGVMGFASLLERTDDLQTARRYARRVNEGVRQVDEIVKALLGFARSDRRQRRLASLRDLVADAAIGAGLPAQRVCLEGDVDQHVDADALGRVLANLLRNSVEASPDVRVTIRAGSRGGRLELLVQDDGPGVPAEIGDKVFEPFVSSKERGTGLGLPLSARVLAYMGGEIELVSQAQPGACFRIRIPIVAPAEGAMEAAG
ncbi:MAG: hypothetical protein H6838_01705 [Planctomycetes bacterium]|nr:hypothetical protein [Planctomycetota bacterium]MCB9884173.1 hypothetical protein [Planctomycetota bacterium]